MWKGYFNLGGLEIGNSARALAYADGADCPITWLKDVPCGGIAPALGDPDYEFRRIDDAPWYDPDLAASKRFLGAYIIDISGLSDSTTTATVTEKLYDGAQISSVRRASREVRVQLMLTALDDEALEAGMTWLAAATSETACGAHGVSCGSTNFEFFVACPPEQDADETDAQYALRVDRLRRYLHTVTRVSGPFVVQELKSREGYVGRLVEMTFVAATPAVYGVTRAISVPPTVPRVIQDAPYNLVVRPSAEISDDNLVVARNWSANPSLETTDTSWEAAVERVNGGNPAGLFTAGRSQDVAASGTWSYRARILGNGVDQSGVTRINITHRVDLTPVPARSRVSVTMWAAAFVIAGPAAATLFQGMSARIEFHGENGLISTTDLGTSTRYSGYAFAEDSIPVPSGATRARVIVSLLTPWSSNQNPAQNYDIRMYADAVAVTVP